MGLRLYFSPIVGDGQTPATAYRAKLSGLASHAVHCPSLANGTPEYTFAICLVRQTDWTALDADPDHDRLFGINLPDTIETFSDLKNYLQTRTVGEIPALRRQALDDRLTSRGFDTSQITLGTTWFRVLRGVYEQMGMSVGVDGPRR